VIQVKELFTVHGPQNRAHLAWQFFGVSAMDVVVGAKLLPEEHRLHDRRRAYTPADLFGAMAATADGQFWSAPDISTGSTPRLARALARWHGVRYQRASSCRRCLAQVGFSYQRPARVYKSRKESQTLESVRQAHDVFETQLEKTD